MVQITVSVENRGCGTLCQVISRLADSPHIEACRQKVTKMYKRRVRNRTVRKVSGHKNVRRVLTSFTSEYVSQLGY